MSANDAIDLQIEIDDHKKKIKLAEALARLEKNKDYKLVIEHEFMTQEPLRLVGLLSDLNMQNEYHQRGLNMDLRAGSALQSFFRLIRRTAGEAESALAHSEEQLAQLRASGEE